MALNKTALAGAIEAALNAVSETQINTVTARKQIAVEIATAIDSYIRTGDVKTTGTATAQTGKMT